MRLRTHPKVLLHSAFVHPMLVGANVALTLIAMPGGLEAFAEAKLD